MVNRFKSPDEIAQIIFSELGLDYIIEIKQIKNAEGMIVAHHTAGRMIRNMFELWNAENPYTKIDCETNDSGIIDDPLHPDQVSHEILKKVWELVHNGT